MEKSGSQFKFGLVEIVGFGITIASVTTSIILWSTSNFQSKEDAKDFKVSVENRVNKVEADIQAMRTSTQQISIDVSYIRGRLEPKTKN